jgi:tight adherence protein C
MSPTLLIGIIAVVILIIAVILVIFGLRESTNIDPLEARLADFADRGEAASLQEIEMSQSFSDRVLIPIANNFGQIALKFTPQKALNDIERKLELAGNPRGLEPTTFFASRFILAVIFGMLTFILFSGISMLLVIAMIGFGFSLPTILLDSKIRKRQKDVLVSLPDALDLLTICVEAGLGLDSAMQKVTEKWDNELSVSFTRSLTEIQLGKTRREALKVMADRVGLQEFSSFIAAVLQSEQLGVSMAKILRIQSDDMRMKRRQRAEQEAQKAPVKMLFPMALLIFPTIMFILMGPAILMMYRMFALGQ